ncbi:MAG TPA: DUF692 domain-containing protein [Longimicrobium sp.]|jgi:hypothetical protein|uniref:DUF692 domain-containing protein n=1 Tax=Longimicrobium sp. TaxID=2029185 RepID=UPI002EDA48E5
MTIARPAAAAAPDLASLPRLGVGVLYVPSLPAFLRQHVDTLDYMAIVPDRFWADDGPRAGTRFREMDRQVELLDWVAERKPIVGHSVGLSIGSADLFDEEHVRQIARWQARYGFPWHSDHLSFNRLPGLDAHSDLAGLAVPVPYDHDVLEMVAERAQRVREIVPVPFLLENNVYYVDLPDQDMSEPEFLNALSARGGCGLLLDIHNVYANSVNHGFDAREFLRAVDLSRVVELHIAGGSEMGGMYTDSHAGPVAGPVWDLLDEVVAAAPNLCAITFEFEDGYLPALGGDDGVLRELERAREAWNRRPAARG